MDTHISIPPFFPFGKESFQKSYASEESAFAGALQGGRRVSEGPTRRKRGTARNLFPGHFLDNYIPIL